MATIISRDEMLAEFAAIGGGVPDSVQYQRFCTLAVEHPIAAEMAGLDPFSNAYADRAMAIYYDLRGRGSGYEPERDEDSGAAVPSNLWRDVSPWGFRDATMIADFFYAWGQMARLLALPPGSAARVLEYGTGSGQLLLFLARTGMRTFAVDIDQGSLAQVEAQSNAMGLDVQTDRAPFGEGFPGQKFDRIVFFEAFHHAIDFMGLLQRLQDRLDADGRLVFCGEPIVDAPLPVVPYSWGPRLDALSAFSIRHFGWMELGFTRPFFVEALHRTGWFCEYHPFPFTGRAHTFVAQSCIGREVCLGHPVELGRHAATWSDPEGTHRCATSAIATLPLPSALGPITVEIVLFNPLPMARTVSLSAGSSFVEAEVPAHVNRFAMALEVANEHEIKIACAPLCVDEVIGNGDQRFIGAIVKSMSVRVTGG